MHAPNVTPPRVLLANLEPMTWVGMKRLLADGGIEVVEDEQPDGEVVAQVGRLRPDAVVLGFDGSASLELSRRVRAVAPTAKVILWTHDETSMEVFDPGSNSPRRIQLGVPAALLQEFRSYQASPREE